MRLSNETINHFANKGINVKYYPEKTFTEFKKRVYNDEVQNYIDYYKNHVHGCESVKNGYNELFASMGELRNKAIKNADSYVLKYGNGLDPYEYTTLIIEYNNRIIIKKIAQKSKLIDIDYIQNEITKNDKRYSGIYGKFAQMMQKLLNENNITNHFVIYPTTYGIGVWCFYNFNAKKDISLVTDIMNRNNIEYYNEFSDAHWVYRFKISKKHANIAKLI